MVKLSTCSIKSKSCSLKSFRKQYYTKKLQHTFCNKYLNVRMKKITESMSAVSSASHPLCDFFLCHCSQNIIEQQLSSIFRNCSYHQTAIISPAYSNSSAIFSMSALFCSSIEDMIFTEVSSHVMFLLFSNIPVITLPAIEAQDPFSIRPIVLF